MKRRLLLILALVVLAGAIVNVAVASGMSVFWEMSSANLTGRPLPVVNVQ
jgi:hypothetical protein